MFRAAAQPDPTKRLRCLGVPCLSGHFGISVDVTVTRLRCSPGRIQSRRKCRGAVFFLIERQYVARTTPFLIPGSVIRDLVALSHERDAFMGGAFRVPSSRHESRVGVGFCNWPHSVDQQREHRRRQ